MPAGAILKTQPTPCTPCQAIKNAAHKLQALIEKILDFVLPRNPVTERREIRLIPLAVENALGASLFNSVCPKYKTCPDKVLTARVKTVFERVVKQCDRKDLKYEVRLLEDQKTVNAFCTPGGKVVITTALLNKLRTNIPGAADVSFDDKVAAIVGHEITHAAAGHGARSMQLGLLIALVGGLAAIILPRLLIEKDPKESEGKHEIKVNLLEAVLSAGWRISSFFIMNQRSRCHEYEADKYGIKYAAKAGYKMEGALWIQSLFSQMQSHSQEPEFAEFLRTHPFSEKRYQANKETIERVYKLGISQAFGEKHEHR